MAQQYLKIRGRNSVFIGDLLISPLFWSDLCLIFLELFYLLHAYINWSIICWIASWIINLYLISISSFMQFFSLSLPYVISLYIFIFSFYEYLYGKYVSFFKSVLTYVIMWSEFPIRNIVIRPYFKTYYFQYLFLTSVSGWIIFNLIIDVNSRLRPLFCILFLCFMPYMDYLNII